MIARDVLVARRLGAPRRPRVLGALAGSLGFVLSLSSVSAAESPGATALPSADAKAGAQVEAKAEPSASEAGTAASEAAPAPGEAVESDASASGSGWVTKPTNPPTPGNTAPEEPRDEADAASPSAAPAAPPAKKSTPKRSARYALPESTETATEAPPADYEALPLGRHQEHWVVSAGARVSWLGDEAFDPFSEEDAFSQVSLAAGRVLVAEDRLSLAVLGVLEAGEAEAYARSMKADYSSLRFALSLEGRYHLRSWLYGYARLAPGALRAEASLESPELATYEAAAWSASVDGALGAAVRIIGARDGSKRSPRVWLFAEGGYGWAASQELSLEATSGSPPRAEPIELGELDPSGGFLRLGANLTF